MSQEKLRADKKEIQREYSQWKALPDKIGMAHSTF